MRIAALLATLCLVLFAAAAPAAEVPDALKEKVKRGILFPAVPGEPRQLLMALEFTFGAVENAAHWAARTTAEGNGDTAKLDAEITRLNEMLNHLQNLILYRIADPKKRVAAVNELLKFRMAYVGVLTVVMEKSDDPNGKGNLKRYGKAAEQARKPLQELAKLLGI